MLLAVRFLKVVILLFGIGSLGLSIIVFPHIYEQALSGSDSMALVLYGVIAVLIGALAAQCNGLYHFYRLLMLITHDSTISQALLQRLHKVTKSTFVVAIIFMVGFPLFYLVGEVDDAPGVILLGMLFIITPLVITACLHILHKLFTNTLKSH